MNVLLTGASGQLGLELQRTAPSWARITACDHAHLDITDSESVEYSVARHAPEVIINTAAHTRVDDAESHPAAAHAVNAGGVAHLAAAAAAHGARLIQVSTDFVFDGLLGRPYRPDDEPNPVSVYGRSKRAGETAALAACADQCVVLRTSWLYAATGHNFVNNMLRLMREREELGVVTDQVGNPTWAAGLAAAIWEITTRPTMFGIYHWSDAGVASWYDFAIAIGDEARARGLLERNIPIRPLATREFPRPAPRPASSTLDSSNTWARLDTQPTHWRRALGLMLDELTEATHAHV